MPRRHRRLLRFGSCAALVLAFLAISPARPRSQESPLRGFTADGARDQRQWEQRFRAEPRPEHIRRHLEVMSAAPHVAGLPGSRRVAEYAVEQMRAWGLDARLEIHEALMPLPLERVVELVTPERVALRLEESALDADPDASAAGHVPTFNAYAGDGDVTAEVVYVNYGTPEDFERLDRAGISVKDRIVLARYGRSWRGIKPKLAWERGAIGCLIYSDPRDDGYFQGVVYPEGPWRPETGVQRGSVMDMPVRPGDPLTPGTGAEPGVPRLAREEAETILKIPVLPISYGDALPILRHLGGAVVPEDWRGALPVTYRFGPGPARVRMALAFDWQVRPLYNVVARLPGREFPDEWIVYGNHHDAWGSGATDPTSGAAVLLETARALAALTRQGWRPQRTIVLTLWDGEEWGLLGSTEWAEKHADELKAKAVVYINTDSTGAGWLGAGGSHSLEPLVSDVARDVPQPGESRSVLEALRARTIANATSDEAREAARRRTTLELGALGSGSDYTAFLDHLTIASVNLGFGGAGGGGVYHSAYDTFRWYTRFSDGDFTHGVALSQVVGTLLLRLAGASVVPFAFTSYAATVDGYIDEVERLHGSIDGAPPLAFARLRAAAARLAAAGSAFESAMAEVSSQSRTALNRDLQALARLNRVIAHTERGWAVDGGLPSRPWFRHVLYAPGLYTGYGVKTLPGIREGVEQRQWDDARRFVDVVAERLERVAADVDAAARQLRILTSP